MAGVVRADRCGLSVQDIVRAPRWLLPRSAVREAFGVDEGDPHQQHDSVLKGMVEDIKVDVAKPTRARGHQGLRHLEFSRHAPRVGSAAAVEWDFGTRATIPCHSPPPSPPDDPGSFICPSLQRRARRTGRWMASRMQYSPRA